MSHFLRDKCVTLKRVSLYCVIQWPIKNKITSSDCSFPCPKSFPKLSITSSITYKRTKKNLNLCQCFRFGISRFLHFLEKKNNLNFFNKSCPFPLWNGAGNTRTFLSRRLYVHEWVSDFSVWNCKNLSNGNETEISTKLTLIRSYLLKRWS